MTINGRQGRWRLPVALVLLFWGLSPLAAQDLAVWFSRSGATGPYVAIRPAAELLAVDLAAVSLPDSLLVSRLEEGAKKRVRADRMIETLRGDATRLVEIADALKSRGLLPQDRKKAAALAEQAYLLFRAGIGRAEFDRSLDEAVARLGRTPEALSRSLAALAVAAEQRQGSGAAWSGEAGARGEGSGGSQGEGQGEGQGGNQGGNQGGGGQRPGSGRGS